MSENSEIKLAKSFLRLAGHHLIDDQDALSRQWAARHINEAINRFSAVNSSVVSSETALLKIKENDWSSAVPSKKIVWDAYDALRDLLQREGSYIGRFSQRYVPRLVRDFGVVLVTIAVLFAMYRKYNDYPVNLWSNKMQVMDVIVEQVSQGYGQLQINKTVDNVPVMINGKYYDNALGTHAESRIEGSLRVSGSKLTGGCGYPDSVRGATVFCIIEADGRELFRSPILSDQSRIANFEVPVAGISKIVLRVSAGTNGINAAHAVWVDLRVANE